MMDRRSFLLSGAALFFAPLLKANASRFQFCMLRVGSNWDEREHALVRLASEIQKRCNIPIQSRSASASLRQVAEVDSPFFIIAGKGDFPAPTPDEARLLRIALQSGGTLLFDDNGPSEDKRFYQAANAFMRQVFPELSGPQLIANDHAVYQSYFLLKEPRGRQAKKDYLEGWANGNRIAAFFSHNDLLGALESDRFGNWKYNMEMGGRLRRELCFRLAINMVYYTLTLHYKKDRAFPPIIERRRRL